MKKTQKHRYNGKPEESKNGFPMHAPRDCGKMAGRECEEETAQRDDRYPDAESETIRELEELRESHLRLAADFENFKRHARKDLLDAKKKGRDELLKELAVVISELESAAAMRGSSTDKVSEGVALTIRTLHNVLEGFGYERVPTMGEPMNPQMHEAVAVVPVEDDGSESGIVVEEMTPGFTRENHLVLPARVVVSRSSREL